MPPTDTEDRAWLQYCTGSNQMKLLQAVAEGDEANVRQSFDQFRGSLTSIDVKAGADAALVVAAHKGREDIVRLCHDEWGATDVDSAMRAAAAWGHEAIVRMCHGWGANVDSAIRGAIEGGHENIVRLCHEWGATDVDRAMSYAAGEGQEAIVRLCHDEWGATDIKRAMRKASKEGQIKIVQLCHDEWGATDASVRWKPQETMTKCLQV